MAPPFIACRICQSVEGKLKNYTDNRYLIRAYEKLTGCPFVELLYMTKFCPRCACLIRKMYNFRKNCINVHNGIMDYLSTGRKITKRFVKFGGPYERADTLSSWQTCKVPTVDYAHNPKAYKSKKKFEVEGIIGIKHVTVPHDPSAEIPIKPKPEFDSEFYNSDYVESDDMDTRSPELEHPVNVPTPANAVATPIDTFEAPMILKTPMNNLEVSANEVEVPMNVSEAPMNDLEATMNDLEPPVNVLVAPVLREPDVDNEERDELEVKIEDMVEDNFKVATDEKSIKLEQELDPDDVTLHDIKAEMLAAVPKETEMDTVDVGKGEKRKTGKKKDKLSGITKKSQRLQEKKRRNKSNEELEEHFFITQFQTEEEQVQEFLKRREGEGYMEGKYKCELCLKSFKEQKWMDAHVQKHEPSAGSYVCSICKIRCRTPKLFRTHRDCNHTTRFSCRRCNYYTYSKAQALKHHGWHEGVEHSCQHCGATFRKHTTYMGHLRRAHPSAHICGACARSFVSAYGLNLHVKAVHKDMTNPGPDSTRCDDCGVTFVSRQMYIRHVLITDTHKDIARDILGCRKCGEQFDTKEDMERHTHYKERKYVRRDVPRRSIQCDQCPEVFSHPNGVYQHYLRAHPDTPYRFAVCRRYLCEQCGKTFKSPGLLQQHALTHLGLRPPPTKQPPGRNTCRLCGKSYSKLSGLFRHKLTHMGVRRHKCHICEKAFTDTSNLKQHVQGVHLNIRRIRKR